MGTWTKVSPFFNPYSSWKCLSASIAYTWNSNNNHYQIFHNQHTHSSKKFHVYKALKNQNLLPHAISILLWNNETNQEMNWNRLWNSSNPFVSLLFLKWQTANPQCFIVRAIFVHHSASPTFRMSLHQRTQNQTHGHQTKFVHHYPISPAVSPISSGFQRRFWLRFLSEQKHHVLVFLSIDKVNCRRRRNKGRC